MTNEDLEHTSGKSLAEWNAFVSSGELDKARELAQLTLGIMKNTLRDTKPGADPMTRNKTLILGILFRGLIDFIDLMKTTLSKDWTVNHPLVEEVWTKMWDCKQRIEYVTNYYDIEVLSWVLEEINNLEKTFLDALGPGYYFSTEILAKKEMCNICNSDYRSCEHISGNIYEGVICATKPQNFQLKSVSIVENPADPRCRIWPWQIEEGGKITKGHILTVFRKDDFMEEIENQAKA